MPNKTYILIGGVVALIGVAVYFFSTGNIPMGGNQLTRAKAEQMIWEREKTETVTFSVEYEKTADGVYGYDGGLFYLSESGRQHAKDLEKDGLIKIRGGYYTFEFTDAAQPYLLPAGASGKDVKEILIATPTKVEVTGLTEPSEGNGKKTMTAEYKTYYDVTPFGLIIGGYVASIEDGQE